MVQKTFKVGSKVFDVSTFAPVINSNHRQNPQKWDCCFNLLCITIALGCGTVQLFGSSSKDKRGILQPNLPSQVEHGEYFVIDNKNKTD